MKKAIRGLVILCVVMTAGAASAGQCGYVNCWGAVGIGPNGEWGWSTSFEYEGDAVARVQAECPRCNNIQTFYNTCGAMATGRNGAWGFGWASTQSQAEGIALGYCSENGPGCQPVVWSCSH